MAAWRLKMMLLICGILFHCEADLMWERSEIHANHISVGKAGVWATHKDTDEIFYRAGTWRSPGVRGSSWVKVPGALKRLDVGKDVVWGVNVHNQMWLRTGLSKSAPGGDTWTPVGSGYRDVSVSQGGRVWAVKTSEQIWRLAGSSKKEPMGTQWEQVPGALVQISVGEMGLWGVNRHQQLYYRLGTYGDEDTSGTDWQMMGSGFKYVSSSDDVIAVKADGTVHAREGITESEPTGTEWVPLNKTLRMVESFKGQIRGINQHDNIWRAKYQAGDP